MSENIRIDLTTEIANKFLERIVAENLCDEEVFFILAKLVRLMTFAIENTSGKEAGDIAFLNFIKMYDCNTDAVQELRG